MKKLIVVAGPTAVGKTSVAIQLAKQLGTVVVSCDSRQFFREMNIGTAKPTATELAQVQHYFIDSLSIFDPYTVGDFERECHVLLNGLYEKHDSVILCGGSGLYIKAVCEGLDHFPNIPSHIRPQLMDEWAKNGIAFLQDELQRADPVAFANIDTNNPHRLLRALEVCLATGKPYSSFLQQKSINSPIFEPVKIMLDLDREVLYNRINRRVDEMLKAGLLAEVEALLPHQQLNALQTVGYQELFDYFNGKISYDYAVELIKQNSRRYAKRQLTWFRKDTSYRWFNPADVDKILAYVQAE
ncbi:MAG: tRNA (adenosine(37)-N6)-dimethylallyltransferase MiaA [Chitinophagales bacterium]|nr:tRNA (adenosine(37)-N6)-dimethylallyltransferase MiaA [Chitinophagales bacterium]